MNKGILSSRFMKYGTLRSLSYQKVVMNMPRSTEMRGEDEGGTKFLELMHHYQLR
jgi:hypothetical protein